MNVSPAKYGVFEDTDIRGHYWEYHSLAELNKEWEDVPEEPKVGYIIDPMEVDCVSDDGLPYEEADIERAKELGIWSGTKEEAEKAVEKLRAWKRLKNKGFRFTGFSGGRAIIEFTFDDYCSGEPSSSFDDLDLLFGGEE